MSEVQQEATILLLSQDLNSALIRLDAKLRSGFDRTSKDAGEGQPKPDYANVLDEIMTNQNVALKHISELHEFLSDQVLRKIG